MIDWSYVAGFFDGEGTIYCTRRKSHGLNVAVSIPQKDNGSHVLKKIQPFALSKGIPLYLHPIRKYEGTQAIRTDKHTSVAKFLKRVYPFLIVKRKEAKRALIEIEKRKWRQHVCYRNQSEAATAYIKGVPMQKVKAEFRIAQETLKREIKKQRGRMRTISEGQTLSWRRRKKAA